MSIISSIVANNKLNDELMMEQPLKSSSSSNINYNAEPEPYDGDDLSVSRHIPEKSHETIEGGCVDIPVGDGRNGKFSFKKLWAYAGPGLLMSMAYLDPGNLESDLQAGAIAGYGLIWVLLWATVMGFLFQCLALRLGVVTGLDLAQACREQYPKPIALTIWVMTEIAIIGSDIQEVVGSAIAIQILTGWELWVGVLITAADTFTFLFIHYFGVRKLEAFFAVLISIMAISFTIEWGIGKPDVSSILEGMIVPQIPKHSLTQAVGMLGAVIMPHNMFLHSSLVLSRGVNRRSKAHIKEANYYFQIEAAISLTVSFFINLCVVAVFAKGFHSANGPCSTGNCDIGLREAGTKLGERFGDAAKYVWAIGLLAAGQSSTMTGTFAGQYVMQGFLNLTITPWLRTLLTRSVALVPAMLVAVLAQKKLDNFDEYLNVLQSIQLPFALLPVLFFNSDKRIVGSFALGGKYKTFLWILVLLVVCTNGYLIVRFVKTVLPQTVVTYTITSIAVLAYVLFLGYLTFRDTTFFRERWLRLSLLINEEDAQDDAHSSIDRSIQRNGDGIQARGQIDDDDLHEVPGSRSQRKK